MTDKQKVFDDFCKRQKEQYERQGTPKTDHEIRKETAEIAHRAEVDLREQKKK